MGSISAPVVTLDYTLRDLYAIDNPNVGDLVFVYAIPSPHGPLTEALPQSKTFPIQGPLATFISLDVAARSCLLVGPESYGFVTGNSPLILFDIDTPQAKSCPSYHDAAARVFNALSPAQRPQLSFVRGPADITVRGDDKQFVVLHPMDGLLHLPHTVDPYQHYDLQSKVGLAMLEGVPTPRTEIVKTQLHPSKLGNPDLVRREVDRMLDVIQQHELPFVLKFPQAFAGQGVFIVQDKVDLEKTVSVLRPEIEKLILQLTESNPSLATNGIIIQEHIPTDTCEGVNFFVTKSGRPVFLGVGRQQMSEKHQWYGSRISYADQVEAGRKHASIVETVARALHERGYFGPCGIDVIQANDGQQLVIDLNPRVTASYQLPLLKRHFYERLGFSEAVLYFPLGLTCNRETFEEQFADELLAGRIVVCGWCESRGGPLGMFRFSLTSLVLAGRTEEDLEDLISRVNEYKIHK
ncbi:hypothetical protein EYZ11_006463 [Aspergillus tanneri]|uniref:ATP-grasp domain-containing protein n=1 Tax=Aspergillus tanneri TaxID=1220188 RepID=A0A4V3UP79_9EURO|nr:uncharacterized protein ATNIH1004_001272 [Aspergillus tanneri]KAA8652368.1 hypothetical protein ATNIH1004_001272 [Aspergillus tanneri]THC94054.1 hypothetical protein EYZ11_006463 [Aspergillus tanneri]